ncbi:MAG: hypothetical protein JWL86_5427 [Rhizobium sp.]|nr:hypothetical protein [Rhizobium sp.]
MNTIILAAVLMVCNPAPSDPKDNGKCACAQAEQNIYAWSHQRQKLSPDDAMDLGRLIIWQKANCKKTG